MSICVIVKILIEVVKPKVKFDDKGIANVKSTREKSNRKWILLATRLFEISLYCTIKTFIVY